MLNLISNAAACFILPTLYGIFAAVDSSEASYKRILWGIIAVMGLPLCFIGLIPYILIAKYEQ